ncbi:MAG: hypothetical protein A2293_08550 [Elusimicrobia bacterium RIFOXYB2_FULL_49_7]|nr:MAG: hypothetical protein A2293_08550 [Elusimicrobia bacterium RIFOXYB2_FULL_49_7]
MTCTVLHNKPHVIVMQSGETEELIRDLVKHNFIQKVLVTRYWEDVKEHILKLGRSAYGRQSSLSKTVFIYTAQKSTKERLMLLGDMVLSARLHGFELLFIASDEKVKQCLENCIAGATSYILPLCEFQQFLYFITVTGQDWDKANYVFQ